MSRIRIGFWQIAVVLSAGLTVRQEQSHGRPADHMHKESALIEARYFRIAAIRLTATGPTGRPCGRSRATRPGDERDSRLTVRWVVKSQG